ncbi:ribosome recycling factor [Anaerotalea alkaliphila]|uniref:Ribosome-recycling factor n=1 Tax=Anaerotalea alkaliphila TaxID=2662126 RepID=A0A7X5HTA3_9FIRM|nr:ribosome recycling factor [Anaerotalea alkaliphila]NDL66160.1 ribosome recycling factor [Anaerotalea alkaliphila]
MQEELTKYVEKMKKTIKSLEEEFNAIRAGRPNPHILDKIQADYYGTPTPIQQLANISIPESRMMVIQPWDKTALKEIEKAIQMSDLGINPNSDGIVLRLHFPDLTEERRKDLSKEVKKKGEDAKVAIRNIRRDANDQFKKGQRDNTLTEDDLKDLEDQIQKQTDKFIKDIDAHVEEKIQDILKV